MIRMDIMNEKPLERNPLAQQLRSSNRVVGVKQICKALMKGTARQVFLARNADPDMTEALLALCKQRDVPCAWFPTMESLGNACGIDVGAAAAAIIIP